MYKCQTRKRKQPSDQVNVLRCSCDVIHNFNSVDDDDDDDACIKIE
jgi:hypothetical protein